MSNIIDDGKYEWEEVYEELKKYIEEELIKRRVNSNKEYEEIYGMLCVIRDFVKDTIHNKLYKNRDLENGVDYNELKIREIVKYVIAKILPYINILIIDLKGKIGKNKDMDILVMYDKYLDIEDDFYAIASYRSLLHFAHYMERDDDASQLVWKYNMNDTMGSIFYYSNAMILDHKFDTLIKQCPTGYGKCFQENEMVLTSTGYKYAKDVKVNDLVYSMKDNEVVLKRVVDKWYSKKKQIKIKTRNGIEIIVSPEHRMFTQRGYIEAKEITKDDYLYYLCSPLNYGKDIDENEMKFISMMIFDGSCSGENIQFSKPFYTEIYKEFMKVCDELHFGYNNYTCKDRDCNILSIRKNEDRPKELLEKYGLYGYYSTNKRLPQEFFTMSLKQRYEFIGIMLATDGYIPKYSKNGGNNVGITLSNKELCKDIQFLMSTCGIYSNLSYKRSKINEKMFDSWVLTIPDEFIEVIYKNCYCYQKQDSLIERYEYINNLSIKVYSNSVNYPKEVLKDCKEFKKIVNKQWSRNKTFKREIVHKYINDKNIISNDFYWNRIVDIECNDEETTMIDFEIEETHNFILNGFVSHNSKSDCVIISFCFGYDINDDIGKWVGNPKLVKVNTKGIVEMIKSKKFAKVFPEFQFENKDDIFSKCAIGDGEFTLSKSKKQISFGCYNKATDTNGLRFNKQFFDDITQMQDAENVAMHEKDIATYEGEWKKRQYDEYNVLRWFTGTAYHREDFLSYIRKIKAHNNPLIKDDNLKTRWAKFVRLNDTKKCVYISIPKLADLDLGEEKCYSTFPQKYSKVEALRDLHKSESARRRFYAMEQQQPQPPETMRFDHSYFRHYKELPKEIMENDCYTYVIIDPNRKGKDNYAGLIFKEPLSEINRFYLVDCYYKKTNSKVAIPCICERAHHHLADYIIYEENTTDSSLLEEKINEEMSKYSDYEFQIDSIYSTEKKEVKINNNSDFILDNIVLPSQDMYYEDSDMGRCINDIVNYTFENNKLNDDSIDCCAMLGEYKGKHNENELKILDDIFF